MAVITHDSTASGSRAIGVFKDLVSRPSGAIGLFLVIFHIVLALVSPFIAPFDYKLQNSALMLSQPDAVHWLGSDQSSSCCCVPSQRSQEPDPWCRYPMQ